MEKGLYTQVVMIRQMDNNNKMEQETTKINNL